MPIQEETISRLLDTKSSKVATELTTSLAHYSDDEVISAIIDCVQERCQQGDDQQAIAQRIVEIFTSTLPQHYRHHHRCQLYHGLADKIEVTNTPILLPENLPA